MEDSGALTIEFDGWVVKPRDFVLIRDGRVLSVEPTPFRVLLFLLRNPGRLVTKDEILSEVWNDCAVSDNSLTRSIATLRKLLADDSREPRYILTVARLGYRWSFPVKVSGETNEADRTNDIRTGVSNPVDSIAVLPFQHLDISELNDPIGEGVATGVIECLTRLARLRVIPRETTFRFRQTNWSSSQVGREVGARMVLSGRLTSHDGILAVHVELFDALHNSAVWTDKFDYRSSDTFAVAVEIARQTSRKLNLKVNDAELMYMTSRPTESREAYHNYLRALHWILKFSSDGIKKGLEYIRAAIDADPAFARPWALMAHLFTVMGYVDGAPPLEVFPRAKTAALRALEINMQEAEAHAALAFVHLLFEWNWEAAREQVRLALQLNPDLAMPHFVLSQWFLTQRAFDEALTEAESAHEIDPLSPIYIAHIGQIHLMAHRPERAVEQFHRALELDPTFTGAYPSLALAHAGLGMRNDALRDLETGFSNSKDSTRKIATRKIALTGIVNALTGCLEEAHAAVLTLRAGLVPPHFSSAYHSAVIFSLLGDRDEAFSCLDMAHRGRANRLAFLAVAPHFGNLRGDPRFEELLHKMALPARAPAGPLVRLESATD
jgi:DNA-binding winged helix-turn-helix (wHTH) protein/tetratricopeptide (TPR) repeat protein